MNVYISTGDTSAEQHSINFIKACEQLRPDIKFTAMGSPIMADAGIDIAFDSTEIKIFGYLAIIKHLPKVYKVFHKVVDYICQTKPNALVLVDFPGFHLRLAKAVKKRMPNIPIIYYITPQVWAWHQSRVKIMKKYIDQCLCILPHEPAWFKEHGVEAEYVGNPIVESIMNTDRTAAKKLLGLDDHTRLISIFPGSRRKEMQYIFKPMMDAVEILRDQVDDLAFAVAAAPGFSRCDLEKYHKIPSHIPVLEGHNHELMAGSYFCFAKSGTTTLEAALMGCPMLAAYRGDFISAKMAFTFMKWNNLRYVALPNIIANQAIVPEFLQDMCNGQEMARISRLLLLDWEIYDQMCSDLKKVQDLVGMEPASPRAAKAFFKFMDNL